ncbi:MAG: DUF2062 domain-containing protein [Candidatus Omnitrophica bacterium]|nr:DUF2062 domain-containing protein [Candidatus Omnitrophota bacterium]
MKIQLIWHLIYNKLFRTNDSPQKIAIGVGLGIFSGIIPGTGPIFSLFLAFIFRVNRAAAVLGSLLTNTWLSFLTFFLAIKIGSAILRLSWQTVYSELKGLTGNFSFIDILRSSTQHILLPLFLGYCIIALFLGIIGYLGSLTIIYSVRSNQQTKKEKKCP